MDIDKEGQIIFEKQQKSRRTVIFGDISIFGKTFFEYFAKNEKLLLAEEEELRFYLAFHLFSLQLQSRWDNSAKFSSFITHCGAKWFLESQNCQKCVK